MKRRCLRTACAVLALGLFACRADGPVTPEAPEAASGSAQGAQQAPRVIPGQYLVVFDDGVADPAGLASELGRAHGLGLRHVYRHALKGFSAEIPDAAVEALRRNPRVRFVEPNFTYQLEGTPQVDPNPAGLLVHLVASDLAGTVSDGATVSLWPNRGSGPDAAQADGSRLPTFHAGGSGLFGGQPHVGFNEGGDDDELLEVSGVASHGSLTLVAVFQQEDATKHNYVIFGAYGSSSSRAAFQTYRSSGRKVAYWDSSNGWVNSSVALKAGEQHVVVWRVEGSVVTEFSVDGTPSGSSSIGSDIPSFDRYLIGAAEPSTSARFDGQIAELMVYDRALSKCEHDAITASLGARYGISVGVSGGSCTPPTAPTDLTATAVDHRQVDLSWVDASGNESGFRIERRLGQAGDWTEVATASADATGHADVGLSPETEFCYRVSAFSDGGSSGFSNVACATTGSAPPPPTAVTVPTTGLRVRLVASDLSTVVGDGQELGSWPNRGSQADAFQADAGKWPTYHQGGDGFNGHAHVGFNEGGQNDENLEIPDVTAHESGTLIAVMRQEDARRHNYVLFAAYANATDRASFVTYRSTSPYPLSYWDPSNGWINSTSMVTAGQDHIAMWRIDASGSADFGLDGSPAGSASMGSGIHAPFDRYIIGSGEPDTRNRFDGQVAELLFYDRALLDCEVDGIVADLGAYYGIGVSASGGGCAPPDGDPADLTATAVDYRQIDLAWTDGSGNEDGFRIERRLGQTGDWSVIAEPGADVTSHSDARLVPETEYCYRVVAFNSDGTSEYTEVACASTQAAPPGACFDTGNHDDLSQLWNIARIGADQSETWQASQLPGCEMTAWYFGIDSGVDSDHPDLNVVETRGFVASEPARGGEDAHGHGTHTAGTAAARDGNGGVVGVAPGAPVFGFRVCTDDAQCTVDDIVAGIDEVTARKMANPTQAMVANLSLAGDLSEVLDEAVRRSANQGVYYAIGAGNGILGACLIPADAANVSPAQVGDDDLAAGNGNSADTLRINGVITVTSTDASDTDAGCNYGNPVTVAAPGVGIYSAYLNGGYQTLSGTSMATPHVAGAIMLYLQSHPGATPAEVEAAIIEVLSPWSTPHQISALGRLNVPGF